MKRGLKSKLNIQTISETKSQTKSADSFEDFSLIGMRIPKDFFVTRGTGESNITVHAGSYHLALKKAGIEMCNIMTYSSIMPEIAREIERPENLVHGAVLETIIACSNSKKGERATAGIIYGWLKERSTGKKFGGLVCEYNGNLPAVEAEEQLRESLNELYFNGFEEKYTVTDARVLMESFVPEKNFGTAITAICFTNYLVPVPGRNQLI